MITLFVIVVIATLVLAVTRAEGMRPLGLALVGIISLVLGAHATAIFTETSVAPLVNSMVFAQDTQTAEAPAAIDQNADDKTEGSGAKTATDEPATQPQESARTSEPKPSEPKPSEPSADEENSEASSNDSEADDATAAEAVAVESTEPDSEAASDAAPDVIEAVTVEPVTNVEYPDRGEDTPSWLEGKPWTKDGVHFVPVVSRLQISESDRDRALEKEIKEATNRCINQLLKNKHATTLLNLRSEDTVPKISEHFEEQVVVTAGSMHQSHALLSFDDSFRTAVSGKWEEVRATSRLMQTGLGVGIVIFLLSTMFSYLKLDTATRGYYTGRLQFAAAAAILAVIAASVLFANYVPWM